MRIDYGPGYRLYFTRRGLELIVLLCGGDKRTQAADIKRAQKMVAELEDWAMRKKVAAKKKVTLTRWDPVENLISEEAIAAYLEAAMEEIGDDPAYIAAVLGDVAKARGILKLAEDTGMTRGGLYRALSPGGNPSFETILKVTKALGLKVTISKAA